MITSVTEGTDQISDESATCVADLVPDDEARDLFVLELDRPDDEAAYPDLTPYVADVPAVPHARGVRPSRLRLTVRANRALYESPGSTSGAVPSPRALVGAAIGSRAANVRPAGTHTWA